MRDRAMGIMIPPTNLKPDFVDQADTFANQLADILKPPGAHGDGRSAPAAFA